MSAETKDPPLGIILQLEIKEECVEEFIQVMTANAKGSREEAGCLRFDFLRDSDSPCKFITYEVFENAAAMDVHKEMSYVKAWGALQYGEKKPVVNKKLLKTDAINLQRKLSDAESIPPTALMLEVDIKEDCVDEFVQVMTADASGSRREPGCLRFDLLRDKENTNKFITYEVFKSQEAIDAHRELPHVKAWGAFQYGDKKPVVNKTLIKAVSIEFQTKAGKKPIKLRKPRWTKVGKVNPESKGINLMLKCVSCKEVQVEGRENSSIWEAVVGDETGILTLQLRNEDQAKLCEVGASLRMQNAKTVMIKGHIRVAVDKWAVLKKADEVVSFEPKASNDMSAVEFELV
eukprot:gnl/MRDRNA2_/MRDRNA2_34561_c0_seq1.p1 gnl/MRDRNA2_/MRDRNA2_34561_c0~~gnl/MRDRNA2_/MRDRNA2_34561_c0_seq1.p1  ORF type:complete len:347 (-),score=89.45 gnl/MRDRNA2_/MRDRNA2_34561_c0_seq1:31-1071(-)